MKRILTTLSQKWPEYLIEAIVIVASILGAFALENWKDDRKDIQENRKFLLALKYELEQDTSAINDRLTSYRRINQRMTDIKDILDSDHSLDNAENDLLAHSIDEIEILTPVNKNIGKNDAMLAKGMLENIDPELNRDYLSYLEYTQYSNDMVKKMGEQMLHMVLQDVYPRIDLDYEISDQKSPTTQVQFNIEELRGSRNFKNAINRSMLYRNVHTRTSAYRIELASSLLLRIDTLLENK